MKALLFAGLTLLFVSGCASMSKEDCQAADWSAIGYGVGIQGEPSNFAKFNETCKEHGVAVSETNYNLGYNRGMTEYCSPKRGTELGVEAGTYGQVANPDQYAETCRHHGYASFQTAYQLAYQKGLKVYCTPKNGFKVGLDGNAYHHVCPKNLEEAFLTKYESGKRIRKAEKKLADLDRKIADNEKEQNDVQDDIDREYASKNPDAGRIEGYRRTLSRLRGDAIDLRAERRIAERQVRQVTANEFAE